MEIYEINRYLKRIQLNAFALKLYFTALDAYVELYNSQPSDKWRIGKEDGNYQQHMDEKHLNCLLGAKTIYDLRAKTEKSHMANRINELFGV
jgi:hypothetical protein